MENGAHREHRDHGHKHAYRRIGRAGGMRHEMEACSCTRDRGRYSQVKEVAAPIWPEQHNV